MLQLALFCWEIEQAKPLAKWLNVTGAQIKPEK